MGWVLVVIVLVALLVRLSFVLVRYVQIRRSGRDVRWETPAGRWYRKFRSPD